MRDDGFDWSPWLDEGEAIVWRAKSNMVPVWMGILVVIFVFALIFLGFNDGSGKAQLAVGIAPWVISILAILLLALVFVRNHYCATNLRLMGVRFAPWQGKPKLMTIERRDAVLKPSPRLPLIIRNPRTNERMLGMILSRRDEESLLDMVKRETAQ